MGMIILAIVCGILANELFAWGPRLSDLLLKIAVNRMSPKIRERMREEWQAHLGALPAALSKLSAAAGFLFSTFWGFRRYREEKRRSRLRSGLPSKSLLRSAKSGSGYSTLSKPRAGSC